MPGVAPEEPNSQFRFVQTAGEIFPDGSTLELVSTTADNRPSFLFWNRGQPPTVALQMERAGTVYVLPDLHFSVWAATTLPTEVVDRGSSTNLFTETRSLIDKFVGLTVAEAALVTAWIATTWFADLFISPLCLLIHGPINLAVRLLRVLSCLTRHALMLTEMSRTVFYSLMAVRPTLLLNQPQMSPRFRALCFASNYRGVVLPGINGDLVDVVSSKAIFVGNTAQARTEPGIHIYLPQLANDLPPLDASQQLEIKARFQPWYLSYRLTNLAEVQQTRCAGDTVSMGEAGQILESCTKKGGQLRLQWAPLLRLQEEDARAERYRDPLTGMLEVLWPRLHSAEKSITMKELTEFTNTLLRTRGENREFSPEELGIKLANEGVVRRRRNSGMALIFDRQTRLRLHQLARSLGWQELWPSVQTAREIQ